MLNISIIDRNKTYRESLKTMLEQIEDFNVVLDDADCGCVMDNNSIQVVLLDISLGKEKCKQLLKKASAANRPVNIIMLAMYKDELKSDYGQVEVMLKSAGKSEFEKTIREIASFCYDYQKKG